MTTEAGLSTERSVEASWCWSALTLLAERARSVPSGECSVLVGPRPDALVGTTERPDGDGWHVSVVVDSEGDRNGVARPPTADEKRYVLEDYIAMRAVTSAPVPNAVSTLLELYLPYCLAPLHARRLGRPFTVSHFAQSLDGRIATDVGDSRWIGCDENQVHAHRMRALCDGILIGARTLHTDRPALTVRHTEGPDPVRIVLGHANDVECLERAGPSPILVVDERGDSSRTTSPQVERVALTRDNGLIATASVLRELYGHGIQSLYIEGGSTTTSAFLAEGNIDVLQLHISPMIIGPGINSFCQPGTHSVADSVRFSRHLYQSVGDGVMFVGRVAS